MSFVVGRAAKPPVGVGPAGRVSGPRAADGETSLEVRNAIQSRLAETSFAVDGEGEQKMMAWIVRYSKSFGDLWDNNAELRNALIEKWETNPAWCLAEVRRQWRGKAP